MRVRLDSRDYTWLTVDEGGLDEWEKIDDDRFQRHGGEEVVTIHAMSMQNGLWTGVIVYKAIDDLVRYRHVAGMGYERFEERVNDALDRLLG